MGTTANSTVGKTGLLAAVALAASVLAPAVQATSYDFNYGTGTGDTVQGATANVATLTLNSMKSYNGLGPGVLFTLVTSGTPLYGLGAFISELNFNYGAFAKSSFVFLNKESNVSSVTLANNGNGGGYQLSFGVDFTTSNGKNSDRLLVKGPETAKFFVKGASSENLVLGGGTGKPDIFGLLHIQNLGVNQPGVCTDDKGGSCWIASAAAPAAVPIPGAAWLAGPAILGLFGLGRRSTPRSSTGTGQVNAA